MKINILGTEYDYKVASDREDMGLLGTNGYCDSYAKVISVKNSYNENAPDCIRDFDSFKKRVKRHEVVHAYLFESGMLDYAENEAVVDWISWQFPKLLKSFQEIGAI